MSENSHTKNLADQHLLELSFSSTPPTKAEVEKNIPSTREGDVKNMRYKTKKHFVRRLA